MEPFAAARALIDDGDVEALRTILREHPELCTDDRMTAEDNLLLHLTNWPGGKPNGAATTMALLDAGGDPNTRFGDDGETVLHWAASNDKDEHIVQTLLDRGADIDALGGVIRRSTPLVNAVYFGFGDVARRLVDNGASIHNMVVAAGLGRVDLLDAWYAGDGRYSADAGRVSPTDDIEVGRLMDEGETDGWTYDAVIAALCCSQYGVVDWFLDRQFDVDRIPHGAEWSCLHHAAYTGSLPMAMFLVSRGARLDVRSKTHDATPADYACGHGHPDVMHYLIDQGTPITLDQAAFFGRLDRVIDADVSHDDAARLLARTIGTTTQIGKPLPASISRGRMAIARYLMQLRPGLSRVAVDGVTAIELADREGDDVARSVLSHDGP